MLGVPVHYSHPGHRLRFRTIPVRCRISPTTTSVGLHSPLWTCSSTPSKDMPRLSGNGFRLCLCLCGKIITSRDSNVRRMERICRKTSRTLKHHVVEVGSWLSAPRKITLRNKDQLQPLPILEKYAASTTKSIPTTPSTLNCKKQSRLLDIATQIVTPRIKHPLSKVVCNTFRLVCIVQHPQ